jgi:hypothetical protein
MKRSRSLRAAVAGAIGGAVLAAGFTTIALAGASSANTVYYACLKSGTLTKVGTKAPTCAAPATRISWNATGPRGVVGPPGKVGPPGPVGDPSYAYVYNVSAETVSQGAAVVFDTNGAMKGVTHVPGQPDIDVTSTGTYAISFSVSGVEPSQFSLTDNGTVVPGSRYGSGAGTQQNSGEIIVNLSAGDTVDLVNDTSDTAVTLESLAGGTQANVNASVMIEQVA